MIDNPNLKPCCRDENNLVPGKSDNPDAVVMVCKLCSCRQIEWEVKSGRVGVTMR